jgi:hypothetical protein
MTKQIYASELGKELKRQGNYRVYRDEPSGLYRIYFVCRELIWSEMNLTFKVGKKQTATPVGYIQNLENFEYACAELDAEYRAMVRDEQRANAKVGA